ncbi:hypothetical protein ILUMI_02352 [Ignelater luminosus]|uniref:DDE-1 domain-containing protein n=1 Tax=Ignelater luminosus TaxID=2038154 RepID=A0A8K0GLF4_IGNLU|nr:hypothetical protein ILUMI_02352 [Ignelater luminosus]
MENDLFGLTYKDVRQLAFQMAEASNILHNFNKTQGLAAEDWLYHFFEAPSKTFTSDAKTHINRRKQVGIISSAERGQLTTAVLCISTAGTYIPSRVRIKVELLDDAPSGTVAACHSSMWIQSELVVEWLNYFIKSDKPKKDDPVLLLLDGHTTQTKNLSLIEKLRNNPGCAVRQYQISKLFGTAYCKTATLQNAMAGFAKTGIFPTNPHKFTNVDFAAAATIDKDRAEEVVSPSTSSIERVPPEQTSTVTPTKLSCSSTRVDVEEKPQSLNRLLTNRSLEISTNHKEEDHAQVKTE